VPGDTCHKFVTWSLEKGLEKHPDWFPSFQRSDSEEQNFKQIQGILYNHGKAGCGKPCLAQPETASPPTAEFQKAPVSETEAPVATVAEAKPEAAEPTAEDRAASSRSKLVGDLQAEIKALQAMKDSPSLEKVRAEKRNLIHNLFSANRLEAELKTRHLQNLQTATKLEADLKALEAMDTTPALEILRAEKRTQIQKLQTADKSDSWQTVREVKRLEDPAASAAAFDEPTDEEKPALAQKRQEDAEERPPRSDLIGKLEAELRAMDQIHISPALETLREEKRQLIQNLQTADKLEVEFKARQLQNLQTVHKLEAELKALEVMDDTGTRALEILREEKRTALDKLKTSVKTDAEQTTQEIQRLQDPQGVAKSAAPPAAPAAIVEPDAAGRRPWWQRRRREATPDAKEEARPDAKEESRQSGLGGCQDAAPGDRCHEFVTWALGKGLEQHPDWFASFERSGSDEQNFKQMQGLLYSKGKAGCGKPC